MRKYSDGRYEVDDDIVHLWYPQPVHLDDEAKVEEFFGETLDEWIRPCVRPPYLLVNYTNVALRPDMADAYARAIQQFSDLILGTFRYGLSEDALGRFTAVAVRLGNMKLTAPPSIYSSETAARDAIRSAKATRR